MEHIQEKFEIEIAGKTYTLDLAEVSEKLVIDPAHLDQELEWQAPFLFWVSTLCTNAIWQAEEASKQFEIEFSEMQRAVRQRYELAAAADEKAKVPAQTGIDAEVKSSQEYRDGSKKILELKRISSILETVKAAVVSRQYLLIERSRRFYKDEAFENAFGGK